MSSPDREPSPDLTAWLIEWPADDNMPPRWWHPKTGWMLDASKASRFARKEDAEAFIREGRFCAGMQATEHKWIGAAPSPSPDVTLEPVAKIITFRERLRRPFRHFFYCWSDDDHDVWHCSYCGRVMR